MRSKDKKKKQKLNTKVSNGNQDVTTGSLFKLQDAGISILVLSV
jgi:hypothetical protein